jgi:cystathionine beta-synthase
LIDGFTKVTDKCRSIPRKIALEEGIFVGNSAGAAIKGLLQLKEHFARRWSLFYFMIQPCYVGK